jgi:hypothetical protein
MLLDKIRELLPSRTCAPSERKLWQLKGMHSVTAVTTPAASQADDFDLIIYFQHIDKPECQFGFKWANVKSYVEDDQPDSKAHSPDPVWTPRDTRSGDGAIPEDRSLGGSRGDGLALGDGVPLGRRAY